jgi:hypothetical protein
MSYLKPDHHNPLQSSFVAFTTYVDSLCLLETISLPYKHFFLIKKNCYTYNLLTRVACNYSFFFLRKIEVKMQVDNNRMHSHLKAICHLHMRM